MRSATDIVRLRRRARASRTMWPGVVAAGLTTLLVLTAGVVMLSIAMVYAELTAGFPPIEEIELAFGTPGGESLQTVQIYDRSGEFLLYDVAHPATSNRKWLRIRPGGVSTIPRHAIQATIAAQDETYWTNPGYIPSAVFEGMVMTALRRPSNDHEPTITQRLAQAHLLPLDEVRTEPWVDELRSALLAAELTRSYPKEQILEWYLNSAYYGNLVYGIDAASLFYFGKHAGDLNLAESAMLAAVSYNPSSNPVDAPEAAREQQAEVLRKMVKLGMIEKSEGDEALDFELQINKVQGGVTSYASEFALFAWQRVGEILGPNALHRGGLRVITTLDRDLQLQNHCAARTQLERLSGGQLGASIAAADDSACIAAGLLPTLRPSDVGVDHRVSDVALVVLDTTTGEILSMVGPAQRMRPTGTAYFPFIYVTAFAQGYSPGTMVLDIPPEAPLSEDTSQSLYERVDDFQGPVRMRTALANADMAAAIQSLKLVGVESVMRTADTMGLLAPDEVERDYGSLIASGMLESSLVDLTFAYSLMANHGRMTGVEITQSQQGTEQGSLEPVAVLRVEDAVGRWIYTVDQEMRAVLSPQLAFLMADILSDEATRWPIYGQASVLEIGKPAGVQIGTIPGGSDNWTIGFTPSKVVGVWIGNLEGRPMQRVHALNGAAPIWHAAIRYSTRDAPRDGWSIPPGINSLEVCDPSGLLPTRYCPNIVREMFISGTEPTMGDNLFQPFLVNKETGKLATLSTPLEVVEERVYMIPPPGAEAWADLEGIEKPPTEYDTLFGTETVNPEVNIISPESFEVLRGEVIVRGNARPEGLSFYRLQFGQGLNPLQWTQIGADVDTTVRGTVLGRWHSEGLNGLYTLQLQVVLDNGRILTSAVHVTIDNSPPEIRVLSPSPGSITDLSWRKEVVLEADIRDEMQVDRAIFYVNGRAVATVTDPPYSTRWYPDKEGNYVVYIRAYDVAGNETESERIIFSVTR
ncbi:MAG: hypothetical protein GTO14_20130 [Anaerolineales bacterium]|nr:hypothetical protein [Anaerolineales bacterium]